MAGGVRERDVDVDTLNQMMQNLLASHRRATRRIPLEIINEGDQPPPQH
jgi:hypothetical protein